MSVAQGRQTAANQDKQHKFFLACTRYTLGVMVADCMGALMVINFCFLVSKCRTSLFWSVFWLVQGYNQCCNKNLTTWGHCIIHLCCSSFTEVGHQKSIHSTGYQLCPLKVDYFIRQFVVLRLSHSLLEMSVKKQISYILDLKLASRL